MCRSKMGNPKKSSRFICLKCGREIMDGIQRPKQREKLHIKDLYCIFDKETVKAVEIRYCDNYNEVVTKVPELKEKYYTYA